MLSQLMIFTRNSFVLPDTGWPDDMEQYLQGAAFSICLILCKAEQKLLF